MPVQKGQSPFLVKKLGQKGIEAAKKHAADEMQLGNVELPDGIENGIAQLVDCRFMEIAQGKQNAGQPMFFAAGIVKSPDSHNGTPIAGLRTQISEVLFDTPTRGRKTVEEHIAWVQNEFKKLGVTDPSMLTLDQLETTAKLLKESKPHFRFRTWKGDKQETGPYAGREPRVNHQWAGLVNYEDNGQVTTVEDNTGGEPDEPPDAEPVEDLSELAMNADNGDEEAASLLTEKALEAGVDEEAIKGADNWAMVVEMIQGSGEIEAEEEEPAAEAAPPQKGELYKYKMLDPKTKRHRKVEVEVIGVSVKNKTVTLKNNETKKPVLSPDKKPLSVPWDAIEPTE